MNATSGKSLVNSRNHVSPCSRCLGVPTLGPLKGRGNSRSSVKVVLHMEALLTEEELRSSSRFKRSEGVVFHLVETTS